MDLTSNSETLDVLIAGGGPAGTAAAFRSKELGLRTLVIDFDDILKRIRDYAKEKLILPDFGGGDRMTFPVGGNCISALQFEPIDKDEICARWKGLYESFEIPRQIGVELLGIQQSADLWVVETWDHKRAQPAIFRTRHLVLALGRGVPRRLDIPGNLDGLAYRLSDPGIYQKDPVLVIGGGTSAAEAVIAVSNAKMQADDPYSVFWSYRGTKIPHVSMALASRFFEAYTKNGNIRTLPDSEPVAVVTGTDRNEYLSVRVDRRTSDLRPPETTHLEFPKSLCVACIGQDLPEALLAKMGVSMVLSGPDGNKMMAVTPLLETQQPNVYMIGDLLSQSYLETNDFSNGSANYRQVKHRGNIKSALRDGVFIAEVIKQRVDGCIDINVMIQPADSAATGEMVRDVRVTNVLGLSGGAGEASTVSPSDQLQSTGVAFLVQTTPVGIEAEEYRLNEQTATTLGRTGCAINFPDDPLLSDAHASITHRDNEYILRDDGSRSGTYLRIRPERPARVRHRDLIRAGRQILVMDHNSRDKPPYLIHYDATGRQIGHYRLGETTVFGRSGGRSNPDIILDEKDSTLSRFHMGIVVEDEAIAVLDFASRNGTFLKVDTERTLTHGDIIRIGSQQLEVRLGEDLPEKTGSRPVATSLIRQDAEVVTSISAPHQTPTPGMLPSVPYITFARQNISGPIDPAKTLLAWADENGVSIDYECWSGMCGCDVIRIVAGGEHLNTITEKEIRTLKRKGLEPGPFRLACMARTYGPVVIDVVN